jgi:hypothetical protein
MAEFSYWQGMAPAKSDFGSPIDDEFIDGRSRQGPWGIMTPKEWQLHGVGLGQGFGQCYKRQPDGRWLKTVYPEALL